MGSKHDSTRWEKRSARLLVYLTSSERAALEGRTESTRRSLSAQLLIDARLADPADFDGRSRRRK